MLKSIEAQMKNPVFLPKLCSSSVNYLDKSKEEEDKDLKDKVFINFANSKDENIVDNEFSNSIYNLKMKIINGKDVNI